MKDHFHWTIRAGNKIKTNPDGIKDFCDITIISSNEEGAIKMAKLIIKREMYIPIQCVQCIDHTADEPWRNDV